MTDLRIYFDHNATTPLSDRVKREIPRALESWGNPSSIHWAGREPKLLLREARQKWAQALNVSPLELMFTSGGSEANNAVIKGVFFALRGSPRQEYITTKIEHPSVLKTFRFLETQGATVHYLDVNRQGQVDLASYRRLLSVRMALVSVMMANNETGLLLPVGEMTTMAHQQGALFHTDAVQALGKIPLQLKEWRVDFASFSAHKFYSLKGTGLLYAKKGSEWIPLIEGGAQERSRRGGTENVLGIHAFGCMAEELDWVAKRSESLSILRDYLEARLLKEIPGILVTHAQAERLPNTSSLVLPGVDGETLLMSLDLQGFAVSTGAACSSGNPEPSPVLLTCGLSRQEAQSSLRLSLGYQNTQQQVDLFVVQLQKIVERLRRLQEVSLDVQA